MSHVKVIKNYLTFCAIDSISQCNFVTLLCFCLELKVCLQNYIETLFFLTLPQIEYSMTRIIDVLVVCTTATEVKRKPI